MYDYVVIGGGSAGCVLAARLSEDLQVRVALLEAGGVDSSVLIHCPAGLALMAKTKGINWRFQTVPQPGLNGRRGYQPRGKVLGGSSSINAMIYIRGQRQDYDDWAAAGNPGWSFDDVLPWFRKAEGNLRGADDLHGADGPLSVQDLRSPNPLADRFIQAGVGLVVARGQEVLSWTPHADRVDVLATVPGESLAGADLCRFGLVVWELAAAEVVY